MAHELLFVPEALEYWADLDGSVKALFKNALKKRLLTPRLPGAELRYTLDGSGFWQNALSNWDDYDLRLTGGGSVKLEKWLALTAAVVYDRFTRTRSRNTLFTFGATIQR